MYKCEICNATVARPKVRSHLIDNHPERFLHKDKICEVGMSEKNLQKDFKGNENPEIETFSEAKQNKQRTQTEAENNSEITILEERVRITRRSIATRKSKDEPNPKCDKKVNLNYPITIGTSAKRRKSEQNDAGRVATKSIGIHNTEHEKTKGGKGDNRNPNCLSIYHVHFVHHFIDFFRYLQYIKML